MRANSDRLYVGVFQKLSDDHNALQVRLLEAPTSATPSSGHCTRLLLFMSTAILGLLIFKATFELTHGNRENENITMFVFHMFFVE